MHCRRTVLLSPTSVDTTTWPGPVSPPPSSGGETDGFAEQLSSADSALTEESTALQTGGAENSFADSSVIRNPVASIPAYALTLTPTSNQSATASSAQSVLSQSAMEPSAARSAGTGAMDVNNPSSRLRGNRPDVSPGKTLKDVTLDDGQPKTPAAALIQAQLPIPSDGAKDAGTTTPSTNKDLAPMARRISGYPGTQSNVASTSDILMKESFPDKNPPVSATAGLPAVGARDESPEELAFAVKVQPVRLMGLASRNSASASGNAIDAQVRQASAGKAAAADSENADSPQDSEAGSATQARDNGADQASPVAGDGTAKDANKKSSAMEGPQHDSTISSGLTIAQADSTSDGVSRNSGGAAGKSGASTPSGPVTPDEVVSADQSSAPTTPMKDISVRVQSVQGQNVDVIIVQRAGDLQIAVRSADSDTTQGLRHGLSELTTRLNQSGYQAETWRPAPPASAGSGSSSQQPPSGNSQSNPGWSGQNQSQRDSNPPNRPRWVQELESNLAGGTESTGQFHGLVS